MNSNRPDFDEQTDLAEQTDTKSLGETLKRERIKRGLSLRAAGELIGISHSYLASLENGADPRSGMPLVPSQEVITKICKAYKLETKDTALFMNFGSEDELFVHMARMIFELKGKDPIKYRRMLDIVMGNSEE
ncbi:MAG: helix-turn-helix domain-containing protein [Ruminococcaceae bacterium]|nr:helix-turn-helix domain-containing protein [Oscillospiraceae bacterium]